MTKQVWPNLTPTAPFRRADDIFQVVIRVIACLLPLIAVVWVLIAPEDYLSCLVLAVASVPLAIVGVAK